MSDQPFTGTVICSLVFLRQPGLVLLARKQKRLIIGCWNGHGGRKESGESILTTAAREFNEENNRGVVITEGDLEYVGVVYFHNQNEDGTEFTVKVFVYLVWKWTGEPGETDEMKNPTWFPDDKLPLDEMAPGDRHWIPLVLAGRKLIAHIYYGPKQKTMIKPPEIEIMGDPPSKPKTKD